MIYSVPRWHGRSKKERASLLVCCHAVLNARISAPVLNEIKARSLQLHRTQVGANEDIMTCAPRSIYCGIPKLLAYWLGIPHPPSPEMRLGTIRLYYSSFLSVMLKKGLPGEWSYGGCWYCPHGVWRVICFGQSDLQMTGGHNMVRRNAVLLLTDFMWEQSESTHDWVYIRCSRPWSISMHGKSVLSSSRLVIIAFWPDHSTHDLSYMHGFSGRKGDVNKTPVFWR